jgi:hypothetical protein
VSSPNNRAGYIDFSGDYVIEPQFLSARDFTQNGLAKVVDYDSKLDGYINHSGQYVIQPQFGSASDFSDSNIALVAMQGGKTCWYIDAKGNNIFGSEFFGGFNFTGLGLAVAIDDNYRVGFINEQGEYVIKPQFRNADSFSENYLAPVMDYDTQMWGYIDEVGNLIVPYQFASASKWYNF